LISIWFCVGATAAWIGDMVSLSFNLQLIIFLVVSLISLICTRPLVKKFMKPSNESRTNVNSLIDKEAVVTQKIDNLHGNGEVKINGQFWTARSCDGSIIAENCVVIIEKIEGVKLLVKMKGE
jgi:membrane protein implicated in regulation of membrane protease activity